MADGSVVPRRSHPLHFYSSLGVSSFKCVFGGNFIFIFFLSSKAQEFCISKQVPLGTKSLDTFALPSFAAPVPSLLQRLLGCFSFGFTCRERIYVYVPVGKLINTYTRALKPGFHLFPTQRHVPELMDTKNIIHILLILVLNKGRESEELFNIRPSLGCTLGTTKCFWLQSRYNRGLERR